MEDEAADKQESSSKVSNPCCGVAHGRVLFVCCLEPAFNDAGEGRPAEMVS